MGPVARETVPAIVQGKAYAGVVVASSGAVAVDDFDLAQFRRRQDRLRYCCCCCWCCASSESLSGESSHCGGWFDSASGGGGASVSDTRTETASSLATFP